MGGLEDLEMGKDTRHISLLLLLMAKLQKDCYCARVLCLVGLCHSSYALMIQYSWVSMVQYSWVSTCGDRWISMWRWITLWRWISLWRWIILCGDGFLCGVDYFVGSSCLRPWVEYFAIHILHSEMFPYLQQMSAALS